MSHLTGPVQGLAILVGQKFLWRLTRSHFSDTKGWILYEGRDKKRDQLCPLGRRSFVHLTADTFSRKSLVDKYKIKVSALIVLNILWGILSSLYLLLHLFLLPLPCPPFLPTSPFLCLLSFSPQPLPYFSFFLYLPINSSFIFYRRLCDITNSKRIYWQKLMNWLDITWDTLLLKSNKSYLSPASNHYEIFSGN